MKNLKTLRQQHGLTQLALQMKTGIDQGVISKYESGERLPTIENLMVLADFFNTSLDFLMDRTTVRQPYTNRATVEE